MTEKIYEATYSSLVGWAEACTKSRGMPTRFEMVKLICELVEDSSLYVEVNSNTLNLVDKLYADGFVKA